MTNKQKEFINEAKAKAMISIAFIILMFALSSSKIVYVPISDERVLDLSLVPVVFIAMICGYKVAIPIAIAWTAISVYNLDGMYPWYYILSVKASFSIALVYFYGLFKKKYQYSPWNVYRTIIAAVTVKNLVVGTVAVIMFPGTFPVEWLRDNLITFVIELAICLLAMSLLIEKLRQVHILNGVKRKEKIQREHKDTAHNK